jgi:hypothetical protein
LRIVSVAQSGFNQILLHPERTSETEGQMAKDTIRKVGQLRIPVPDSLNQDDPTVGIEREISKAEFKIPTIRTGIGMIEIRNNDVEFRLAHIVNMSADF